MGIRTTMPPGATPLAAVDAIMAKLGRERVEIAIETLLALLDMADPDIDLEDSETGNERVDARGRYIGEWLTPTDDDGTEPDCDAKDFAWIEQVNQTKPAGREGFGLHYDQIGNGEDAEDDDPAEDDSQDRCVAGDDHMISGPVVSREFWERWDELTGAAPGDDEDHERGAQPTQTAFAVANDA